MRFSLSVLSLLLATAVPSVHGRTTSSTVGLRGGVDENNLAEQHRNLKIAQTGFWNETINGQECTGAVCAMYGDPHIITCDGLKYDCQAEGLFTLMENDLFSIQGHLHGMKEEHRLGHLKRIGGSLLNDAIIKFHDNETIPILQLGFGDVSEQIEEFPSQVGCTKREYWYPRKKHRSICSTEDPSSLTIASDCTYTGEKHNIQDVYMCRDLCESTEGCEKFNFWYDRKCELYKEDAILEPQGASWNLNLAGTMEGECGVKKEIPELKVEEERHFHGKVGKNGRNWQGCPLLMHLDGELQDISHFNGQQKGYLHGDENSEFSVRIDRGTVFVKYRTSNNDWANFKLSVAGAGPGEKWSCHWHMLMCLPSSFEEAFDANPGTGLLGSVNGYQQDDWMFPNGTVIDWEDNHQAAFDYCDGNWCVEQSDSMMAFPGDWTWEDVKCSHKEFKEVDIHDPECVLNADYIINACAHVPSALRYGCELDCCYGGCDQGILEEIIKIKRLQDDPEGRSEDDDDGPDHDQCHPDDGLLNTGDTICPGAAAGSVVKLLQSSGLDSTSSPTLFGANDIIYGLALNIEPNDRVDGKNLRFHVNNPFGSTADIYIQHDRNVLTNMVEPACVPMIDTETGCDTQAPAIEVACRDFHNGPSYALVHVYFSSPDFPSTEGVAVDKCCFPEGGDSDAAGVIEFIFSIQCGCPDDSSTA